MAKVEITASYWVVREGITEKTTFKQRPIRREGACQGDIWEEYARKKRESTKSLQGEHAYDVHGMEREVVGQKWMESSRKY